MVQCIVSRQKLQRQEYQQWSEPEVFELATNTSNTVLAIHYLGEGGVLGGGKDSDFAPLSRHH